MIFEAREIDGTIYWFARTIPDDMTDFWYIDHNNIVRKCAIYAGGNTFSIIMCQSRPTLDGVPVLDMNSYVELMAQNKYPTSGGSAWNPTGSDCNQVAKQEGFIEGYQANENVYTENDMYKALSTYIGLHAPHTHPISEILDNINRILVLAVDDSFRIVGYK